MGLFDKIFRNRNRPIMIDANFGYYVSRVTITNPAVSNFYFPCHSQTP
jgi:hypothetical protein